MINGIIAIFCIPMMHTPWSLIYVIRLYVLVKFNPMSMADRRAYKTKFKITKIVYGTALSQRRQQYIQSSDSRNIKRQLKSHNFVLIRDFMLPLTMYWNS